jgi:NADH-ubiquinone oxidoreductase chain 5
MAKSAQIGLHTWLPDAMEGPTPVSALIHVVIMVPAGTYLMIQMVPFFECPSKLLVTATILGGLTAIFGATVARGQPDLKQIIYYLICSQLGYIVVACGTSQFKFGLAHLVSYALFKAMLFLGAATVIYMFSGQPDIRKMGGLRLSFPLGVASMALASCALAGLSIVMSLCLKEVGLVFLPLQGLVDRSWVCLIGFILVLLGSSRILTGCKKMCRAAIHYLKD